MLPVTVLFSSVPLKRKAVPCRLAVKRTLPASKPISRSGERNSTEPRHVVSEPASLPLSLRSWTVNSRLPRSGSSIVPSQRPSTATAARPASPETTSAACRSAVDTLAACTTLVGTGPVELRRFASP